MIRFLKILHSCQGFGRCLPEGMQIAENDITPAMKADAALLVDYGLAVWVERWPVKTDAAPAAKKKASK